MTEVDVKLGRQIRRLREQLGMSQEELAKKLGYKSKSSINKVETGSQGLTQSKIMRFAEALQTTPGELLDWDSDDAPTLSTPMSDSAKSSPRIFAAC